MMMHVRVQVRRERGVRRRCARSCQGYTRVITTLRALQSSPPLTVPLPWTNFPLVLPTAGRNDTPLLQGFSLAGARDVLLSNFRDKSLPSSSREKEQVKARKTAREERYREGESEGEKEKELGRKEGEIEKAKETEERERTKERKKKSKGERGRESEKRKKRRREKTERGRASLKRRALASDLRYSSFGTRRPYRSCAEVVVERNDFFKNLLKF